jgi:inhibitor of cysteine peptidase
MYKRICNFVFLFVFACGAYVCAKEISLQESDTGKSFSVEVGDTLNIMLEGNPSTGYTWDTTLIDKEVLSLIEKSFTPSSTFVGAGGVFSFKVLVMSKGKSDLHMRYTRLWEKDVLPVKTFDITVSVEPSPISGVARETKGFAYPKLALGNV